MKIKSETSEVRMDSHPASSQLLASIIQTFDNSNNDLCSNFSLLQYLRYGIVRPMREQYLTILTNERSVFHYIDQ